MLYDINLKNTIKESFTQYSGAVIQSRALVDVRDCVKPSARQIYYSLFTDNFIHEKPFKKTLKAIGSCMRFYIHGDSSCEGVIMRSGQPFSLRYPLVEVEGSYGNLTETGNWAASRYTASRLSEIANYLIQDTNIHTVEEWIDNYDDTEQYPRILSSLGFYNIVNGTTGIAVGTASSVPQFNLIEVNEAMKKLVENPDIDFEEIFCYPDFATGGTIINKDEVKESLKNGQGKACVIRAKITYQKKDNALVVSEMPYGVYTNTICSEVEKLALEDESLGIVNLNDLTGEQANIKIYLSNKYKNNIKSVQNLVDFLYAKTSLQKSFSVNMTMLENGRYPKVYGWKEALLAHIEHERQTYINLFTHQKDKLSHRLSIVIGILAAINSIDEVVATIRAAKSTSEAISNLVKLLNINDEQAKAILDIKLAHLARLESDKFKEEKKILEKEIKRLTLILNSKELLNQEMIKKFDEVSSKFGDERRTKVIQKEIIKVSTAKKKEEVETKSIIVFKPIGYIQNVDVAAYRSQGYPAFTVSSKDLILLFSNKGKFYRVSPKDIKKCGMSDKGTPIGAIIKLGTDEKVISVFDGTVNEKKPYLMFAMKNGMVKKAKKESFFGTTRNLKGMVAIKGDEEIVSIQETNGCVVTLYSKEKQISFMADTIRTSGKGSGGIKGMVLAENDAVVDMKIEEPQNFKGKIQARGGKGIKLTGF
jgi:DNA gyrase subunit A